MLSVAQHHGDSDRAGFAAAEGAEELATAIGEALELVERLTAIQVRVRAARSGA